MTAGDLVAALGTDELEFQRLINAFIDEFRGAPGCERPGMLANGPQQPGKREGLLAAVASALCREVRMAPPRWVQETYSPEPYFAFPAKNFALRLLLMLESPPPFRVRNVFVPENYLARA